MDFLDEYKSVMEKYAGLKVFVGAHRNGSQCCIDYGNHSYMRFWCDHGVYCFDIEERGEVRKGGMFNSPSIDLTQKVMLNYTVSILRHSLGLPVLGVGSFKKPQYGATLPLTAPMVSIWILGLLTSAYVFR